MVDLSVFSINCTDSLFMTTEDKLFSINFDNLGNITTNLEVLGVKFLHFWSKI